MTREELLKELEKEYVLTPIRNHLTVSDIFEKHFEQILKKCNIDINKINNRERYSLTNGITNAIRKVVCLKYGVMQLREIKNQDKNSFREDINNLIENFILRKEK